MKPQFPWVTALQVSEEQLVEWRSQAPEDMPLLFWCLSQGRLNAVEYLHWAKEHYQLPLLDEGFFADDPVAPKDSTQAISWGPWLCPVAEWEDVLVVACVEPPPPIKWPRPMAFVLAPPECLEKFWKKSPSAIEAPVGLNTKVKKAVLQLGEIGETTSSTVMHELNQPAKPAPAAPTKPAAKSTKDAKNLPSSPEALTEAKTIEQAMAWAFKELLPRYSHMMCLREKDNHVAAWLWSKNWKAPKKDQPISLEKPSLFRIASKTKHPYHGFIVNSPTHQEFFQHWGFEDLPEAASALPLLVNDEVWGLLLCVGDETSESPEALRLAEQVAHQLSAFLSTQSSAA